MDSDSESRQTNTAPSANRTARFPLTCITLDRCSSPDSGNAQQYQSFAYTPKSSRRFFLRRNHEHIDLTVSLQNVEGCGLVSQLAHQREKLFSRMNLMSV